MQLFYCNTGVQCTFHIGELLEQAEGLQQIMGGKEWLQKTLTKWSTVLAAHGPYTAAGGTGVSVRGTALVDMHAAITLWDV